MKSLSSFALLSLFVDHTNSCAHATVLRPSSSVTLCIVAKWCVLEQKLLLTAYRKSHIGNRQVLKWMILAI